MLTQIIAKNQVKSVTIVRMEVPCCGGLEQAVKRALQDSGRNWLYRSPGGQYKIAPITTPEEDLAALFA